MNDSLPEGFNISRVIFPPDDSPSLGKVCKAAEYLLKNVSEFEIENFYSASLIQVEKIDDWTKIIIKDPAQNPIGGLVKFMISENIISGWQDINIVRTSIGIYDEIKGCVSI